jgi:VWFA-related protein
MPRFHSALPAVLLFAALPLGSQAPAPGNPSVPVIHANTRAVVVDVVVTKGQDEPVASLKKQDFQLLEDGKPQSIDFFEEHTVPAAALTASIPPLPAMPPNVYTNVPAAPQADAVYVLLLDTLNTPRPDQSYVRQQILDYLRTARPEARMAIFVLGSRLSLVQGFTDDPAILRAALGDKKTGFAPGTTDVSRTREDDQADKDEVAARAANLGGHNRSTAGIKDSTSSRQTWIVIYNNPGH